MILDSRKPDGAECLASLGLTFAVNLRPEEGGEMIELIPNGAAVAVTPGNVLDYVKKYAMLRMVKVNGETLQVHNIYIHCALCVCVCACVVCGVGVCVLYLRVR
jgi:E3 ubiquitin-protein ligase EDD1